MAFSLVEKVDGQRAGRVGPPRVTISPNGQVRLSSAVAAKLPAGAKYAVLWADRNKKGEVQAIAITAHPEPPTYNGKPVSAFPLSKPAKFGQWHFSAGPTLRSLGVPFNVTFDSVQSNGDYVAIVQLKDAKPIVPKPKSVAVDDEDEYDDAPEEGEGN